MSEVGAFIVVAGENGPLGSYTLAGASMEIEYRVYDANGDFYAAANAQAEAVRYLEQPGDYMTKAYIIEERIA